MFDVHSLINISMNHKHHNHSERAASDKVIRKKVREAEIYLKQGLFAEARQIYIELIDDHRTYLNAHAELEELVREAIRMRLEAFEGKLHEIELRAEDFERYHMAVEPNAAKNDAAKASQARIVLQNLERFDKAASDRIAPVRKKSPRLSKRRKPSVLSFATVCRHPITFLLLSVLVASVFAIYNPSVKMVNNVDYFKIENNPDRAFYDHFKSVFGNDEFFVIAYKANPLFSHKNLTILDRITKDLARIKEIRKVTSLANVNDIVGEPDYFDVRHFLAKIPDNPRKLASLKTQAVDNYLYVKNLLSKDAKTAAIVVETYNRPKDQNYRKRLLTKTRQVLNKYRADVPAFYLGGWTTTNFSLSQYLKADMKVFVPATYLLIALTTWIFFKNLRLTFLAVANISVCLAATRGLMGMTGVTMNNVTSIVIPLIMALSLSDTVHIFSHLDKRLLAAFPDKSQALAHVLKKVAMPCFLTTLTTAIGFMSLAFSDIVPIKQFAWIASGGMVFEYFFSFFLLPPLILFFKPESIYQESRSRIHVNTFIEGLSRWVRRYHRMIVVAGCLVIAASLWLAGSMRVETNLIKFFKKSSPVRTSLNFVESRLCGVGTLDISLRANAVDAFKQPKNLRVIAKVQRYIDSLKHVDKTMSFVDFLKDMNASFHNENNRYYRIPESERMVSQYLLVYDSDDIDNFINDDYDQARISVRISQHSSSGQKLIVNKIRSFIASFKHPGIVIRVTGRAVINTDVIDAMVRSQITSLSSAALVISFIMFLVFRSIPIACLSMIPNLFPIALNFGIMGAAGIPLNTGTALIAAVSLGIAVDDTIHFLTEYQRQRAENRSIKQALQATYTNKGQAILISSAILFIGFGIMVFSRFVPIIHFGLLSAIIMVTALIGDLVVLPAIMLLKKEPAFRT